MTNANEQFHRQLANVPLAVLKRSSFSNVVVNPRINNIFSGKTDIVYNHDIAFKISSIRSGEN